MKKIYTAIDIGSDTIKIVVGEMFNDKLNVLSSNEIKSKGIRKGLIVDPNLAINSIKDGIKEINNNLGIDIKRAIVNVPEYNSNFMFVTGKIMLEESQQVDTECINRVIKDSVYAKIDKDYELITVIPLLFYLDDKEELSPIGKTASSLSIKGIMVSAPKKNVYSVLSVMEGAGIEVVDITVSGLCDYYAVRNNQLDKKIGAIINLGHETTNVSIYNRGKLMNTEVVQLGGVNIDKDLAYMFNISIFDAREIKEKFASSHKRFIALNDVYEIKNTVGEELKLNQIEVTEIVQDRLAEILELAKKQILLLTKKEISYIVITGGLTEIRAFKNLVYEILGKDVIIYNEETLGVRNNKYTTAVGMIKYFDDKMMLRGREYSMLEKKDEDFLINPSIKNKKDKTSISKLFGSFIGTKED